MQANWKIHLHQQKKTPIYKLSHSKTPKCNKFSVTDIQENPLKFFHGTARAPTLAPEIILLTQVLLQKFLFL